MIDINKKYKTREGHEVRIYATDGGKYSVHGAVKDPANGWISRSWTADGKFLKFEAYGANDLVEVKPRIKRTVYLHVFENSTVCADQDAYYKISNRLACVKVDIDVEEGHGL